MNMSYPVFSIVLAAAFSLSSLTATLAKEKPPGTNEKVAKLEAVLKSGAPQKEKADALRELAIIGTKESIATVASLLGDETMSHMARYALEPNPSPAVDEAFRAALPKLKGRPLVGVIGSLGIRRDAKAVPALKRYLHDYDTDVAQASARALGRIGTKQAGEALLEALRDVPATNQLAFAEGLLRCADALAVKGPRSQAIRIYDYLRGMQTAHQVRTAAWRGAILARKKDGLPLLKELLQNEDYALFVTGARISLEMPGEPVTLALAAELSRNSNADRQILLTQILGRRQDPAALPSLTTAATQREKPVRIAAIKAIAEFGSPKTVPALLSMMQTTDSEIARAAQEALASIPGKEADEAVLAMLDDKNPARCVTGLDLAARRRMTAAVPRLLALAGSADQAVRIAATRKLGELAGPDQAEAIIALVLKPGTSQDLEAAENALNAVCARARNPENCVAVIKAKMSQTDSARQAALLRVIAAQGGPAALAALRETVSSSNAELRTEAIRALGNWSTGDSAPVLLEVARSSSSTTDKALAIRGYLGLAGNGELKAEDRLEMCRQATTIIDKEDQKKLLLGALGTLGSAQALELIKPLLDDQAVRGEAETAALNVADRILKPENSGKPAAVVVELLEKIAENGSSDNAKTRAKSLLEKAKAKK